MMLKIAFVLSIFACLLSCSVDRAAIRDCAKPIVEHQLLMTAEESAACSDKTCVEDIARQRALIAASYIEACMANKDGGGN